MFYTNTNQKNMIYHKNVFKGTLSKHKGVNYLGLDLKIMFAHAYGYSTHDTRLFFNCYTTQTTRVTIVPRRFLNNFINRKLSWHSIVNNNHINLPINPLVRTKSMLYSHIRHYFFFLINFTYYIRFTKHDYRRLYIITMLTLINVRVIIYERRLYNNQYNNHTIIIVISVGLGSDARNRRTLRLSPLKTYKQEN